MRSRYRIIAYTSVDCGYGLIRCWLCLENEVADDTSFPRPDQIDEKGFFRLWKRCVSGLGLFSNECQPQSPSHSIIPLTQLFKFRIS